MTTLFVVTKSTGNGWVGWTDPKIVGIFRSKEKALDFIERTRSEFNDSLQSQRDGIDLEIEEINSDV